MLCYSNSITVGDSNSNRSQQVFPLYKHTYIHTYVLPLLMNILVVVKQEKLCVRSWREPGERGT